MEEKLRQSGIDVLGDLPSGTHLCLFYETREDLVEILAPYFKEGLENNEFCMWVTSEPLTVEEARTSLENVVKHLDSYIEKGQIEILDASQWYTKSGRFEADKVLQGWIAKEDEALKRGFDGLRLSENTLWLEKKDWRDFADYEAGVDNVIGQYRMIAICSYSLDKCRASEVIDVLRNHQWALARQEGRWGLVQSLSHKRAEEALRESEEKYHSIFETAANLITSVNEEGIIVDCNSRVPEVLGYDQDEITGQPMAKIIHPDFLAKAQDSLKEILTKGFSYNKEYKMVRKDGTLIDVSINSAGLRDEKGEFIRTICIIDDITERKRMEEEKERAQAQLLQAQRMNAIGILVSGVAHEFNNLLGAIQGFAELAMMQVDEADPSHADLRKIVGVAERGARLTRQLLLYGRKHPMEPTLLNLNRTVGHLLEMLNRLIGEDIAIKIDIEPGLWTVRADEASMEQVIMNLAVNAREAMPEGGELAIKAENVTLDEEDCKAIPQARPGKFVCLSVADTGVGMDEEILQRIFEPFFTTKKAGAGLGLSVVYGIVRQHEG